MNSKQDRAERRVSVDRFTLTDRVTVEDWVACEEPLEIRLVFGEQRRSKGLAITMRTPGADFALATGFLLSEGIIHTAADVTSMEYVGPPPEDGDHGNTLMVELRSDLDFDASRLQRHFYTTSSCGVCGKASLEAIHTQGMKPVADSFMISKTVLFSLAETLRREQQVFSRTGGLHAAGLFTIDGRLLAIQEDVGRHNAVDKLLGERLRSDSTELRSAGKMMVVSGRASFELVQKTVAGGMGMLVAVGAPSSLAVQLADEFRVTLIGFSSQTRFNVYTHAERIANEP